MTGDLPGWLQVGLGLASLILALLPLRGRSKRRRWRQSRVRLKFGKFEFTSSKMTDDQS